MANPQVELRDGIKMNSNRPNILLIVSEDNGQQLGCYGDPYVATPNLDLLASQGVRFVNAYTTQAVCSPGRASILTGLYPHQNGQFGLATHKYAMYEEFPNIPSLLKPAGYRTGIIGKLHVNPEGAFPFDFWWNDRDHISFQHRDMAKATEVAASFIDQGDGPFFLMVNYPDAHLPFLRQECGLPEIPYTAEDVAPLPFGGIDTPRIREHTADYYNCMSRLDTGVGMLLEALDRTGKSENTLVIFTTDHGAQLSRGKTAIYEGGLRVPSIVRWPGTIPEGLVREELVSHIDILSTVLEATDVSEPAGIEGHSLLPLARGETVAWRDHIYAEWVSGGPTIYFPQRSVRDKQFKFISTLLQDRPSPCAIGYSGPGQKWEPGATIEEIAASPPSIRRAYEIFANPPTEELYDLQQDPWEFNNLIDEPDYAATRDRLRAQLQSWQLATQDPLADPGILARLTNEHDEIVATYYPDAWGISRAYTWEYGDYMRRG